MSTVDRFVKDPSDVLDYRIDWQYWLAESETISASSWTVEEGITRDSDDASDTEATVWLSGGTAGVDYTVTNRITTNQGRIREKTLTIVVQQR